LLAYLLAKAFRWVPASRRSLSASLVGPGRFPARALPVRLPILYCSGELHIYVSASVLLWHLFKNSVQLVVVCWNLELFLLPLCRGFTVEVYFLGALEGFLFLRIICTFHLSFWKSFVLFLEPLSIKFSLTLHKKPNLSQLMYFNTRTNTLYNIDEILKCRKSNLALLKGKLVLL
jgi:hypothetical protein